MNAKPSSGRVSKNVVPSRPLSERVTAKLPSGRRKAKQAFKDEVDINSIVARFVKSGVPIPAPQAKPQFYDMTTLPANLQDALALRERLRSSISTFSPSLQAAFNAHPEQFMRDLDSYLAKLKAAEKAPRKASKPSVEPTPTPTPTEP